MQIFVQGKRVKTKRATGMLSERMTDSYKPQLAGRGPGAEILIGFSDPESLYGIMMYHNNRLIKPMWEVRHSTPLRGSHLTGPHLMDPT